MIKVEAREDLTPRAKLGELIKACIERGADSDGKVTKTKLAKLVYLADFAYYYHNLQPITGVTYKKLDQGPVSLAYFDQLLQLLGEKQIQVETNGKAEMFSLGANAKKAELNKKELELVQAVCDKWRNKKTEAIVKFTHDQFPWKVSFCDDEVPYSLIIQENEATLF
jgi:uncharacterized phage-associated protein